MYCFRIKNQLNAYLEGELSGREQEAIARHFAKCRSCAQQVAETEQAQRSLRRLPEVAPPAELKEKLLARLQVGSAEAITCATAEALIRERQDRPLTPLQTARLEYHLAGCLFCRREAEAAFRLTRALASLSAPPAPSLSFEQVKARAFARQPRFVFAARRQFALAGAMATLALGALLMPGLLGTQQETPPIAPGSVAVAVADRTGSPAAAAPVERIVAVTSVQPIRRARAVVSEERTVPTVFALAVARPKLAEEPRRAAEPNYDEAAEQLLSESERDRAIKAELRLARLPAEMVESEVTTVSASFAPTSSPRPQADPSLAWKERLEGAAERTAHTVRTF